MKTGYQWQTREGERVSIGQIRKGAAVAFAEAMRHKDELDICFSGDRVSITPVDHDSDPVEANLTLGRLLDLQREQIAGRPEILGRVQAGLLNDLGTIRDGRCTTGGREPYHTLAGQILEAFNKAIGGVLEIREI